MWIIGLTVRKAYKAFLSLTDVNDFISKLFLGTMFLWPQCGSEIDISFPKL